MKKKILLLCFFLLCFAWRAFAAEEETKPKTKERDPMVPVQMSLFSESAPVKAKKASVQVSGVGRGPKGAYAIVDGKMIQEGQTKKGITVVKVKETEVDILIDGIEETAPLKQR